MDAFRDHYLYKPTNILNNLSRANSHCYLFWRARYQASLERYRKGHRRLCGDSLEKYMMVNKTKKCLSAKFVPVPECGEVGAKTLNLTALLNQKGGRDLFDLHSFFPHTSSHSLPHMLCRHSMLSLVGACQPSRSLFSLRRPMASSTIQLFVRTTRVIPTRDYSSTFSDNSRPARTTLTTPGTPPPPATKNVQGNFKVDITAYSQNWRERCIDHRTSFIFKP